MAENLEPESNQINTGINSEANSSQDALHENISEDPQFQELLEAFQKAEFDKSKSILTELEQKYPGEPRLNKISNELQMKLSLRKFKARSEKNEKRYKIHTALRIFGVVLLGILLGAIVFYFSQLMPRGQTTVSAIEPTENPVSELYVQAEQLLLVGNPKLAQELIERIRAIDPEYEELPELEARAENLAQLQEKYQDALALQEQDQPNDALQLLKEIEAEQPNLWDVSQRISAIEQTIRVDNLINQGSAAFENENWGEAIAAFEEARLLNPSLNDQQFKEQLFRSYLNEIINMLQSDDTSIDEVNQAANYYRNAVALFPQSRQFADERADLQVLSSDLLELRYTQTAKNLLADPYQDSIDIADAVSYLRKAAKIKPNNSALQLDLQNAEYYQVAFKDFVDMKWSQAATNLQKIVDVDANYAGGNAKTLLFESYYLLGEQYHSAGFYQDAVINLEKAEFLIWDERFDNLMRLYFTQILLGNSKGELGDYENAVSYYRYATNAIGLYQKLTGRADLATKYLEANDLYATENFEAAFQTYVEVLEDIDRIYTNTEIEVDETIVLAFFADRNKSIVDAILNANDLQKTMVIKRGQVVTVPSLEN